MDRVAFRRLAGLTLVLMCGCQGTLGPGAIRRGIPTYNEAVQKVSNAQLLLNLVRLRYRDTPLFVDMGAITQQQTLTGTFGFELDGTAGASVTPGGTLRLPVSSTYSETPTIVMTPLQGDAFFRRLMAPLPLDSVLLLTTSGWNIERALALVLNRINDLHNAETAAGPTPTDAPRFSEFRTLLKELRALQVDETLTFGADVAADGTRDLVLEIKEDPSWAPTLDHVRTLLGVEAGKRYVFTTRLLAREHDHIAVQTRSLLSVMFYLSQVVDVPPADIQAGLVTITKYPDGKLFNWQDLVDHLFEVHVADREPKGAYIAVPYRHHWFYINDNDLESKTTFMLLMQLFNVQAGSAAAPPPQLTIPAH